MTERLEPSAVDEINCQLPKVFGAIWKARHLVVIQVFPSTDQRRYSLNTFRLT